MKKVRDEMGLTNVELMIPFVRTLAEAKAVTEIMAANGLKRACTNNVSIFRYSGWSAASTCR
jgi:phosphoenolpyruvate synthase/pyruvate phosphate dikinase